VTRLSRVEEVIAMTQKKKPDLESNRGGGAIFLNEWKGGKRKGKFLLRDARRGELSFRRKQKFRKERERPYYYRKEKEGGRTYLERKGKKETHPPSRKKLKKNRMPN